MPLLSQNRNQNPFSPLVAFPVSERPPMPSRFFSAISHNTTRINHEASASDRLRSDALQLQRNCILGHRRLNGLATT